MIDMDSAIGETVLIVEDDVGLGRLIKEKLEAAGFRTDTATTGAEAIKKVNSASDVLLLLDYNLPDMTAKQVVETLNKQQSTLPYVVLTEEVKINVPIDDSLFVKSK